MDNLNEKEKRITYANMGIYSLRNYARAVGVKSPTTKKKDEIIDLIIKIENGELEPYNNFVLSKGRPTITGVKQYMSLNAQQLEIDNNKLKSVLQNIYEIVKNFVE